MINHKHLWSLMVFAIIGVMTGCTSTEVMEPSKTEGERGTQVTLKIENHNQGSQTRAGNDHQLRYSALLYSGSPLSELTKSDLIERKEALASSSGEAVITFQVPVGTYTFVVVGDYIPSDSQPDDNGHYEDMYYDMTNSPSQIFMRSFKDFNSSQTISQRCVNNENYDCFAQAFTLDKGEAQIIKDVRLERIVSRVSFVSTTPAPSELDKIEFTSFDFFYHHNLSSNIAGSHAASNGVSRFSIPANIDDATNEVFFFYTLAPGLKMADGQLGDIEFAIKYKDGTVRNVTTHGKKVEPFRNYKIVIKGAFLSDMETQKGDIILNLSSNQNWEKTENL